MSVRERLEGNRPYEKCRRSGPSVLSDSELLAVILRTGTRSKDVITLAEEVLLHLGHKPPLQGLFHASESELCKVKGIGSTKALQLICVAELARRMASEGMSEKIRLNRPDLIANHYYERLRHERREMVILLCLDSKNQLLKETVLSIGTVNSSLLSPRELFLEALRHGAVSVILLHNHPSGDPDPSNEDLVVTKRIMELGRELQIPLLDHIIIGDKRYISLKQKGYMEKSV